MSSSSSSSRLLVRVQPDQSAYFAGERFQCTIQFKNTLSTNPSTELHSRSSSLTKFTSNTPSTSSPSPYHSISTNQSSLINHQIIPIRNGLIGSHHHHHRPIQENYHQHLRSYSIPSLSLLQASPNHHQPIIRSASYLPPLRTQLTASIEEEDHQSDAQSPNRSPLTPFSQPKKFPVPNPIRRQSSPGPQWVTIPSTRSFSLQGHSAPAGREAFKTDLVLGWAYCQLEGIFEYDDRLIKSNLFDSLKNRTTKLGGGQLGPQIGSDHQAGWLGWLFGTRVSGIGSEQGKGQKLPVFENPVSILDVDLHLRAGESRTYTFSIDLPQELPPSFRGKSIKFSYNLIVGTSYDNGGIGPRGRNQVGSSPGTKIIRVPIRVYNHVFLNGARPFYDLSSPIINTRDLAQIGKLENLVLEKTQVDSDNDLEAYARQLINRSIEVEEPEDEMTGGCMTAVEIVTRSSGKVSFDINKDGKLVAELTLVKSAYRLGEIAEGIIVFNTSTDTGRVIKASFSLETNETINPNDLIDPSDLNKEKIKLMTKKVHSDQEEFLLNQNRCKFSLVIPTDGTPEFESSSVKLNWYIRVKFLFLPCDLNSSIKGLQPTTTSSAAAHQRIGSTVLSAGHQFSKDPHLLHSTVSHKLLKHTRSQSFAYGFQPTIKVPINTQKIRTPTHLIPLKNSENPHGTVYKPIPDLGYVPIQYEMTHETDQSKNQIVLVPVKVEMVECWIPLKVFPSNTAFKPIVTQFFA
ncbi:uncharacterized protein MELLADRAFT_109802 [Melampsora larici-populina 98AG31]|uniref:Rgp1-domain-containing protein n=1 Tax=Melampsora larici-populina (strain 98AG31 / pathotype 3-4-7) TaxID=747676 RepID=F4RXP2_MELLP|nr:uncharacterized protein MELLADRAFT_109802 [Melampsora larici-populina 98AG31]EGG02863.1 hypothetical protein MELLADRAFT_109802 [Melampsora larici-populina 98AG31]